MDKCNKRCEVFSRIVGYFRPVQNWNAGKQEEFKDRLEFDEKKAMKNDFNALKKETVEQQEKVKATA